MKEQNSPTRRDRMIALYGSYEAYRAEMRRRRSLVRNHPGGSFKNREFAKAMSDKAVAAKQAKR